jgi:hypothetical protein
MGKWKEYKFKIDVFTPDTLPMTRCAMYLAELANMLGETPHVHFVRLEPGSTIMVSKVDAEVAPKVQERTIAIKQNKGTVVEMRAYRHLNNMLTEDNGTGVFLEENDTEIIKFPGKEYKILEFHSVQQQGEVNGEVIRIGGSKEIVPIILEVEGREISGCHARRSIAKELAKNLFEPVCLYGEGRWNRDAEGEWNLSYFMVDRFDVLQENSLSQAVIALRGLKGEWGENSLNELLESRHYKDKH